MQLKFGSFPFEVNECDVRAHSILLMAGGKPYARKTTMTVIGRFYCDGQADATAKQNTLMNVLASSFYDLILYQDSGAVSATLLLNAGSLGGVVITEGPHFEENSGAEYATQRSFSFTAEAEYPLPNTSQAYTSWTETLSFSGGGPMNTFRPNLYGDFQKQNVYPRTTYKASQRGSAVGYQAKPIAPPPIWPADEHRHFRRNDDASPQRSGLGFQQYETTWSYEFESIAPLIGSPNLWPAGR